MGCAEEEHITEVNFEEVEFAPFVEREFPFITASLLIAEDDELFPENNAVPRCLALILGEEAYACFDTDLLRWAAAWTGEFMPLEGVAHKSYPDFLGRNDRMPYLTEPPHIVTGLYPGWNGEEPRFTDPRPPSPHPDEPSWGPIPEDIGRWNGVYRTDQGPVLSYSVKGVDVKEKPGSREVAGETVFTRTIRIEQPDAALSLVAAEVPDALRSDVSPGRAEIYHEDDETVTVITLSGADGAAALDVNKNRYATVSISGEPGPLEFTLVMWKGNVDNAGDIVKARDEDKERDVVKALGVIVASSVYKTSDAEKAGDIVKAKDEDIASSVINASGVIDANDVIKTGDTVKAGDMEKSRVEGQAGDINPAAESGSVFVSAASGIPAYREGASNPWPEVIRTRGRVVPDTSAYVVDELTLPVPNPWNRNVRVVDAAFFADGRAAVVTFEGDVWMVDGIDHGLRSMSWTRFASGLYEPQSIEVVDGEVYVYGKDGIVRLHDLNGNGAADYYENFSNLIAQSLETREWASDMVARPDGGFYVAKGAALDMGPRALTPPVIRGIRAGSRHSGSVLEISKDGRTARQVATGFRGPYLGIHPETGLLTASDQEGHHVPSTPILVVSEGDYFGVPATAHREPVPDEITPPLLWIPHNVDRSSISQVWITGDKMGPLSGDLIHFSYGRPGLFRVLIDSTGTGVQGGVSVISGQYPAPTMKGAVSPSDGQLYVTGFTLWGTNSDGLTAFVRLRYTGMRSYLPESFKVREGGVVLRFDEELDEASVSDISNYRVERWNYNRTEEYGSGHFRLDGSPGQELLPVFSAHLTDDGKGVFLAIPNIEPAEQMQISYKINASDGMAIDDAFWFTVNHVEQIDLIAEGFSGLEMDDLFADAGAWEALDETGEPVTAERGRELFRRTGCMGCHTTDGTEGTGVGPTMKDLYGSERRFRDGSTEIADEEYIRQTLINPGDRIVEGYDEGMPSFLGILSDDEIDSIVLYIKQLAE